MSSSVINIANWLKAPFNRQAVRRVRDILPVSTILNDPDHVTTLAAAHVDPTRLTWKDGQGSEWNIQQFLDVTFSDGVLILQNGRVLFEWYTPDQSAKDEHIVFSVTKSVIGTLAGILLEKQILEPTAPITRYVPEVSEAGYGTARVRDLLDMTVSLDFEEAYLTPDSPFARYRESTGWHEVSGGRPTKDMHAFLGEIAGNGKPHGLRFGYLSPNSDLLGWVCERAAGIELATLISDLIWKPMGAESPASITLDRSGSARAAGGLSCTLRDMARFGECMRAEGAVAGRQVVPRSWVTDIQTQGNRDAWKIGDLAEWAPGACYRSQWYVTNDAQGAYFAAGIHGQWIYVSPLHAAVIVKQASRPVGPADMAGFRFELESLQSLAACAGTLSRSAS
jgi:CubicO group peptidase (beta-lactamase class C family)